MRQMANLSLSWKEILDGAGTTQKIQLFLQSSVSKEVTTAEATC